jgi:copper chaperone
MAYDIQVENIKCVGCANTISSRLSEMEIINRCEVDVKQGLITIRGNESGRAEVAQLLLKLGYPEVGTAEGLKAAAAKAKSFVSCAVGRLNN